MLSLEDEREIRNVILRYGDAIDRRDWALFRTCFQQDLDADYGVVGKWQGLDAIATHMETLHEGVGPTLHRMSNIMIQGTADGAASRTYVDALLLGKEPGVKGRRGVGYYDDELIRVERSWRISRRRFMLVHASMVDPSTV